MGLATDRENDETNEAAIPNRDEKWRITPTQRKSRTPPTPYPTQLGTNWACSRPDSLPRNSAAYPQKHPVPTKNSFSLTWLHLAQCGNRLW